MVVGELLVLVGEFCAELLRRVGGIVSVVEATNCENVRVLVTVLNKRPLHLLLDPLWLSSVSQINGTRNLPRILNLTPTEFAYSILNVFI